MIALKPLVPLLLLAITPAFSAPPNNGPKTSGWQSLPPIGLGPRQEHSVVAINADIYVLAGIIPSNSTPIPVSTVSLVEVFNTKTHQWSVAPSIPVPLNHANAAVVNGKIYILGGLAAGSLEWPKSNHSSTYDPKSQKWTLLSPVPEQFTRGSAAMAVWGNKILMAGGMTSLGLATGIQLSVSTVNAYDIITKKWESLPPLPAPRDHVGGAVIDNTFYVFGGRDGGPEHVRGNTWALDLLRPHKGWTERAAMLTPRGGIMYTSIGDDIYAIGGEGNPEEGSEGVFDQNEVYNVRRNSWKALERMSVRRHGSGAVAVKGVVYIPGGGVKMGGAPVDVMDMYVPVGN
ncbi:kelch repeat-containing protein-like protein [Peziza echinospora]|nr:kelch repeat-containing protein-like protein [Peziza echinospora]